VAATFRAVFPNAGLWVDPIDGTGLLVGRAGTGGRPIGSEWPGLNRPGAPRDLEPSAVRGAFALGPDGLARYAALGSVITDDNQLLAYGDVRRLQLRYGAPLGDFNRELVGRARRAQP
jgi:hypothetical protein